MADSFGSAPFGPMPAAVSTRPMEKPVPQYGGQVGWSVGLPSWLDSPSSRVNRYWRVVEFGPAATKYPWMGQQIAGLWGDNARPRGFSAGSPFSEANDQGFQPYFAKLGQDMIGPARAALWAFMEGGRGPNMELLNATTFRKQIVKKNRKGEVRRKEMVTRQVHTASQAARGRKQLFFWFMTRAENASDLPFVQGTISREFEARHYYDLALASFDIKEAQARALKDSLSWAMGDLQLTLSNMRKKQAFDNANERRGKGQARAFYTDESVQRLLPRSLGSMAASVEIQSLTRAQGQFVNGAWQQSLRKLNAEIAKAFQAEVVSHMDSGNRPPTGALREATIAPENRYPR